MMEWIEITSLETSPKEYEYVLTLVDGYVGISRMIDGEWDVGDFRRRPMFKKDEKIMSRLHADYWMPLPLPPKGE